jgi:hypothetical protein
METLDEIAEILSKAGPQGELEITLPKVPAYQTKIAE